MTVRSRRQTPALLALLPVLLLGGCADDGEIAADADGTAGAPPTGEPSIVTGPSDLPAGRDTSPGAPSDGSPVAAGAPGEATPADDTSPGPRESAALDDPSSGAGAAPDPVDPAAHYAADGYADVDVIRVDVRTLAPAGGPCTADDTSGCTFADVLSDVDGRDDVVAEVPVRLTVADLPPSGSSGPDDAGANAEIRQRGNTTRAAPQKSFRVRLDKKAGLWRGERRLQLNKHPYDRSRLRNKLAFDLIRGVPDLPSLRTQFVNLWIDQGDGPVDQGLYTHVEAVTKEYLVNRGHDEDDPLYKAELFQFLPSELAALALDGSGAPLDEARFERRLEIKRGEAHGALLRAAADVADPGIPFERTLARHFDADNALAWIVTTLLLGHHDVGSHNYFLHDVDGSGTLRFLPWDLDSAFRREPALVDSFEADALRARLGHGFARMHDNRFTRRWLERPGAHDALVAAATELRRDALSGDRIATLLAAYVPQVRPIVARAPDIGFVAGVREPSNMAIWDAEIADLAEAVEANHRALLDGPHVPLPPFLKAPTRRGDATVLSWEPAFAVSGGTLVYDLEVASRADFAPGSVVLSVDGVADAPGRVEHVASAAELPPGEWYARVVARVESADPAYWQIADNVLDDGGVERIGVRRFTLSP